MLLIQHIYVIWACINGSAATAIGDESIYDEIGRTVFGRLQCGVSIIGRRHVSSYTSYLADCGLVYDRWIVVGTPLSKTSCKQPMRNYPIGMMHDAGYGYGLLVGTGLDPLRRCGLILSLTFLDSTNYVAQTLLAVAATTVARRMSVICMNGSLQITKSPVRVTPRAHEYTVTREANSPLDKDVAVRFGVPTQQHEQTAQRCINAKAKTCICACAVINPGIYRFNLTYVTVAVSTDGAPAEL
eukprot:6177493-Pleurochrysis_carterae.AAC.5